VGEQSNITNIFSRSTLRVVRKTPKPPPAPPFANRLAVDEPEASPSAGPSPDALAARGAATTISNAASSLNVREALTTDQLQLVDTLLAKANEIEREADPQRAATLAADATALIAEANAAYTEKITRDAELADDQRFVATLNTKVEVGTSGRQLSVTLSAVPSLDDAGVPASLSFATSTIDTTISTLEGARLGLLGRLEQFDASRTALSAAVSGQRTRATLDAEAAPAPSIDAVAARLQQSIRSSADPLEAHRVRDLNAAALLASRDASDRPRTGISEED